MFFATTENKAIWKAIFFALFVYSFAGFSQQIKRKLDSLEQFFISAKTADQKNQIRYKQLSMAAREGDSLDFFPLRQRCVKEATDAKNAVLKVNVYQFSGVYFYFNGDYVLSKSYFDSACAFSRSKHIEEALMMSLMSRGAIHYATQQYYNALRDYLESEKLMIKYKSDKIGGLYSNITMIYSDIGDLDQAETYMRKAIPFIKATGEEESLTKAYNNLGLIAKKRKNFSQADSFFNMGLELAKKNGYQRDVSDILYNLTDVLNVLNKREEALKYRLELLELVKKTKEPNWEKIIDLDVASSYYDLGDVASSKKYIADAEKIEWRENAVTAQRADYYTGIGELYLALKDFQASAHAFNTSIKLKNELAQRSELFGLEQIKYTYDKQQDSLKFAKQKEIDDLYNEKKQEEAQHKLAQQRIIIWISAFILVIIVIFSGFLFKANKKIKTANEELTEQKVIVSEKNKEITDSITYAQRIQQSLLPTREQLLKHLPHHFLIYLPKDIVSGDFYWLKEINKDEFFIAAADCTGHGVPGAIMSALSIQQLNEISLTTTEPSELLQKLNVKIKQNLNQDAEGFSKDGLDICLCKINTKEKTITYCGANRALWIFSSFGLKQEIKATKAGIAGHTTIDQAYEQHTVSLEANDLFILSTDGYADQFGGDKSKKITTKQFKLFITESLDKAPPETGELLKHRFFKWKNNLSQIDDVCVLGFKFV